MAVEAVGDVLHAFTGPEGIPYLLDQCPVVLMQSSSFGFNRLLHGLPHLLEPLETPEPRWIRDGATRHHPRDRTGPGPFGHRRRHGQGWLLRGLLFFVVLVRSVRAHGHRGETSLDGALDVAQSQYRLLGRTRQF